MKQKTNSNPLVSVIMSAYNGEKYLGEQIKSILDQSYSNLELIICDDHSTDRTPEIVDEFAQKDPRVKWVRNDRNLNVALTFQKHCHLCRGEYIAPADQDDFWLPKKLEKQVAYLQSNPHVELVFTDDMIANEDLSASLGSFQQKLGNFSHGGLIPIETLLKRNLVPFHVSCFRRSLLDKVLPMPKQSVCMYDHWIALVASLTFPIGYLNECLVLYRQHQSNLVGSGTRGVGFFIKRLNDENLLKQFLNEKTDLIWVCEKLLASDGTLAVKKALDENINNQKALLASLRADNFWEYYSRLIKAGWVILNSSQKQHHFKQLSFLLFSWNGVKRLKAQLPMSV